MLKTVQHSSNRKLGECAATYRAGYRNNYGTCPNSCPLKPLHTQGTDEVDEEYLEALLGAVPRGGCSWTYTHFGPDQVPRPGGGQTVINLSADSYEEAVEFMHAGYPTTVTLPHQHDAKVDTVEGIRFVRCPAEYNDKVTCNNCGAGSPLCARPNRDYVIKFTAHGSKAALVGSETPGGCYGTVGPVAMHWKKAGEAQQHQTDGELLHHWVKTLPYGTKIRHHVVGDIGRVLH